MQIAPFNYIKRSKHFDANKWPLSSSNTPSPQADLMVHLPQIREDHVKYISELSRYSNEVTTTYKECGSDPENKDTAELALRGLQLLSEWTSVVTELYSWKLLHPTDHHQNKECPKEAEEYERVSDCFEVFKNTELTLLLFCRNPSGSTEYFFRQQDITTLRKKNLLSSK